jgi:Uri superfamily endonuclease
MNKGTYCLIIKLDNDKDIGIGKRPPVKFPGGFYCYVGSAMNNLEKRLCRHKSQEKTFRWHIDWFLEHARITGIKKIESQKRLECELSRDIEGLSEGTVMKKFGSSDCSCKTHLHYFIRNPTKEIDKLVRKWKTSSRPTRRKGSR